MSYTYQNKQQSGTETDIITYLILLETFGYYSFYVRSLLFCRRRNCRHIRRRLQYRQTYWRQFS